MMSGLLGEPEDVTEKLYGALSGHPMPGIQYTDENGDEVEEFTFPTQSEINAMDTPFLRACLNLNKRMALFGLPNGKGWIEERNTVLQIREICETEKSRYEAWRMKEGKNLEDRD